MVFIGFQLGFAFLVIFFLPYEKAFKGFFKSKSKYP